MFFGMNLSNGDKETPTVEKEARVIEVENVVYDYPTQRALHGVSLSISPGTVTALVGPNGAGKTTLLRCLAALDRPFSGKVRIDGIDTVADPRGVHARIGYLPDFFGLYDDLTVTQCLTYAARARAVPDGEVAEAVKRTSEQVELTKRMGQRASELSRGLRQRLAIGQAIVHRPKVVMLDEPASGLDPESRRHLSILIRGLQETGATIVVSSHILTELEDYCDQMVIVRDGRIAGDGPKARAADDGQTVVHVRFQNPPDDLAAALADLPDVVVRDVTADSAVLIVSGGADAAPRTLARLVGDKKLQVAAFEPERATLEKAYLAEVSGGAEETAA